MRLLRQEREETKMSQSGAKNSQTIKEEHRVESAGALLIAGLRVRYTEATRENIPAQWQRFAPHIGKISGQAGQVAYGVCWNRPDGGIEYLSGVEVGKPADLPEDFVTVKIPASRYVVFSHREHVSKLPETLDRISKWLPASGYKAARGESDIPDFFERYSEKFDPKTGMGGMEVWVPIQE
jgi:AraC family transcriptional regulator